MNTDIRIDICLSRHWKFRKLRRLIGPATMEHLVMFWGTVAEQVPNGALNGWSTDDIEDAAGWDGEAGVLCAALQECCFLDTTDEGYYPHDWHVHQPWVVGAEERSEAARKAGRASAEARKAKAGGSTGRQRAVEQPLNGTSTEEQREPNPKNGLATPYPSPLPSPSPTRKEKTIAPSDCESLKAGAIEVVQEEPVIRLPLADKTEHPITQSTVAEFQELYPAVDVVQQLRKMRGWLISNPRERKTKNGIMRFMNTWLSKEQDRTPRASPPGKAEARDAQIVNALQGFSEAISGRADLQRGHGEIDGNIRTQGQDRTSRLLGRD